MATPTTKLQGGVEIKRAQETSPLIFMMLWGPSGAGKTTLASTMPGRKLFVNFDPGGYGSVANREDIDVADFSTASSGIAQSFKSEGDPLGLRSAIAEYDSIVVDSLTTAGEFAIARGISINNGATVERPSPGAYQTRNALTLQLVANVLKVCSAEGKHCCFIAHQGAPQQKDGEVVSLPIYLGGQLPAQTSLRFSEVWALYDLGTSKQKTIAIRPCRLREPMKTRMFSTNGSPEFAWDYNPETFEGATIDEWYTEWLDGGKKKIPLPVIEKGKK